MREMICIIFEELLVESINTPVRDGRSPELSVFPELKRLIAKRKKKTFTLN